MEQRHSAASIEAALREHIIGQDEAVRTFAVAVANHLAARDYQGDVQLQKTNILVVGNTGVGKTEMVRRLADYLDVPFEAIPAPAITQAGFAGFDPDAILRKLVQKHGKEKAAYAIAYIDEIDKIARKASDEDDKQKNLTTGTGVQQALLEVIGGGKVELGSGGLFDTRNVLFVLSGAFVGLERVIAHRLESQRTARRSTISAAALLRQVEPQDIVNYGMIPEFVGRLPVIIPMRPLGESDILRILTEPRNAPVRQMIARAEVLGATLTIDPVWLYSVAREAIARGTGARGLIAVLQAHLVQAFFEMGPGDRVHVDGEGMVRIEKAAPVSAPDALAGRVDDESGRVEV